MVQKGSVSDSVGVAPAVYAAAVLPPTISAAAAAFRTSNRKSEVVIPVTLTIVVTGILGTVPTGVAVSPQVVAASLPGEHAAAWAVAAPDTAQKHAEYLPHLDLH